MRTAFLSTVMLALITACSESPASKLVPGEQVAVPNEAPPPASTGNAAARKASTTHGNVASNGNVASDPVGPTIGGDGSAIELTQLQPGSIESLPGELGCSFRLAGSDRPLLVGRADVGDDERAAAAISIGDYVERLISLEAGGFGAMERGTSFGGRGMTVRIERIARQPSESEAVTYTATLLAQRADGAEQQFEGLWTCGP